MSYVVWSKTAPSTHMAVLKDVAGAVRVYIKKDGTGWGIWTQRVGASGVTRVHSKPIPRLRDAKNLVSEKFEELSLS